MRVILLDAFADGTSQAAKRMAEAEKSGASTVLALLRESIASKSIRIVELFNALDTSKDGLISRWRHNAPGVNSKERKEISQ